MDAAGSRCVGWREGKAWGAWGVGVVGFWGWGNYLRKECGRWMGGRRREEGLEEAWRGERGVWGRGRERC